jgi:ketosteroid isomerase-like protein
MSRPLPVCRAAAALLVCTALLGGCATSAGPTSFQERDQVALLTAVQASADAWNRGDLKGHLALYDVSVQVMTKNGPRPSIEAIEKSFGQTYFVNGQPRQQLRMERVAVRALSADSALMTGRFVLHDGNEAEQSGWFTLVWVRTAAGWRAVHDHTS